MLKRISRLASLALFGALIASPLSSGGASVRPSFPGTNGRLLFAADIGGNRDIFSMNPDGSGRMRLTDSPGLDDQPAWSAEGSRIAFASNRGGNDDIYLMTADGSWEKRLTTNDFNDETPTWAPSGARIAFASSRNGNKDIYAVDVDGSNEVRLTNDPGIDAQPAWSPDGKKIAFRGLRNRNHDIYVMNADGSNVVRLTTHPGFDGQPVWSPSGNKIAFVSDRDGDSDILVMNADGSDPVALTDAPSQDRNPAWSPNGLRIAFITNRDGDLDIYVMEADGSGQNNVSSGSRGSEMGVDWQPLRTTPIKHVVVVFQENHSFDEALGHLCVIDQRCDGVTSGKTHDGRTIPLAEAEDFVPRMGHGPNAQLIVVNGGTMDGWDLLYGCTEQRNYRCYRQYHAPPPGGDGGSVPNLSALARRFVVHDRTFQNSFAASWVAHMSLVASQEVGFTGAQPKHAPGVGSGPGWGCDSRKDALWQASPQEEAINVPSCIPTRDGSGPYPYRPTPVQHVETIMDSMDAAGRSWRIYGAPTPDDGYYNQTICPTFAECLIGPQHSNVVITDQIYEDASTGQLPNLSIVIPRFEDSQHNLHSMLQGDNYIGRVVSDVMNGPDWQSTVVFVTWDDCGCFYDHVSPPPGLGLRIPMVIVSPYARAGYTDSNTASFSSILAYVERNFGLAPLYFTDAFAYDFTESLDYSQAPLSPIRLEQHPLSAKVLEQLRNAPPDHHEIEGQELAESQPEADPLGISEYLP